MIEHISIENFQSLENAEIELAPFTVIVGESDVGKSALIRAIHAAVTNQTGQGFIRNGSDESIVSFYLENAFLRWEKGSSANYYIQIDGPNGCELDFDKVRSVPQLVADTVKLSPIKVGDLVTEPNFHLQFDSPYLISESGTVRAKILGELSGVNTLYLASQEALKRIRSADTKMSVLNDSADKLKTELEEYSGLDEEEKLIGVLEQELISLRNTNSFLESLKALKSSYQDAWKKYKFISEKVYGLEYTVKELEKQLADIDICPFCGRSLIANC